jgi:ATP/maltotriose-dependent transcriptional regulator MalT/DNA-binding SARP family transcriptional activator
MSSLPTVSARIARPRLADRVAAGLDTGALLLVADGGFGKTWAIEDAVAARGLDAAWLRVGEDDHEPARFLVSLVYALRGALGDAADTLGGGVVERVEGHEPLRLVRDLVRDLEHVLVEPLAIVIDDGERLDGAASLPLVGELLRAAGGRLRIVVASRRPLGLRVAKLRVSGRLHELGRGDLAFDAEECAALLRARTGEEPAPELVARVMEETEGWPLGIALWSRTGGPRPGDGSREELVAYFAEEALHGLEPALRAALLDAALADEVDATVTRALGLPPDLSEELARRGLFVLSKSADGRFRLHPLFRDFLRRRIDADTGVAEAAAKRRALGRALAASGRPVDGAEQLVAAGAWGEAFDVLAHAGADLLFVGREAVARWLELAPAADRGHPQARLLEGQLLSQSGHAADAAGPLRAAVDAFRARGDRAGEWSARYELASALQAMGELDALRALADGFESVPVPQAPGVAMQAAFELAVRGRPESESLAERALRHPEGGSLRALDHLRRCVFLYPSGDVAGATVEARRAWDLLEHDDPLGMRASVGFTLAAAYAEAGWYEKALASIGAALELTHSAPRGIAGRLHLAAADTQLRLGRVADAEASIAHAGDDPPLGDNGPLWQAITQGALALARGETDRAREHAGRAAGALAAGSFADAVPAVSRLAPLLTATGAPQRARAVIDHAEGVTDALLPRDRARLWHARLDAQRAVVEFACGGPYEPFLERLFVSAGPGLPHLVRFDWPLLAAPVSLALQRGSLEPELVAAAVAEALPDGAALVELTHHPRPEVRAAAVKRAVASGRPDAARRARELRDDPSELVAAAAADAASRATAAPPRRELRLLGHFAFRRGDWTAAEADWGRPLAARIVRLLLVQRPRAVSEDAFFEAFWPDKDPRAARRNLHVNLSHARALLDLPGVGASAIESTAAGYRLRLGADDYVDADVFEAIAARALAERGPSRRPLLEQAASAWGGEPLPEERYAEWAAAWREQVTDRYMQVLDALIEARQAAGDPPGAVAAARELLAQDPLNERAHRRLMAAYARAGRTGHALRQYLECRRLLVEELGVEPSGETRELHARILAG